MIGQEMEKEDGFVACCVRSGLKVESDGGMKADVAFKLIANRQIC